VVQHIFRLTVLPVELGESPDMGATVAELEVTDRRSLFLDESRLP
jgi:hypothetical protein